MASRFTINKPITRCQAPVRVWRNGEYNSFPCGRCSACLLDKANDLSLRLCNEIEYTPFSIFFTLTYSNEYIPKLYYCADGLDSFYYSNHFMNYRWNGVENVRREDNIYIPIRRYNNIHLANYYRRDVISYSSKRDFILWLKLLRKDIDITFKTDLLSDDEKRNFHFRYFGISEYGPTSFRSHIHGVLLVYNPEVAEYLLRISMFKNWKMCDRALFEQYTHYCDGGASTYVTNYLTCSDNLPKIYKSQQIRPFRLSSKNPAIGFVSFKPEEIFENLAIGVNEYIKTVKRIGTKYVFPYPSSYCHRLFPKCREFSLLSYQRLLHVYGFIWRNVIRRKFSFDTVCSFLREKWFPSDYTAAKKCYEWCLVFNWTPQTYLYVLDIYYYKESMFALKKFYEWQQENISKIPVSVIYSYSNYTDRVKSFCSSKYEKNTLVLFLAGFNISIYDVLENNLVYEDTEKSSFNLEVEDILEDMVKLPKFNEKFGFAPHIY